MIIRSRYVGDDKGRSLHLLDVEKNEIVIERHDLDIGCPRDIDVALNMFSALRASNPRAKVSVVHIKCSPSLPLSEQGVRRLIEVVRREHGIASDHPMKVIVHALGDRPMHLHLLFPAVNPTTGKVLSSKGNYRADELASRILEIELGESITPGPRMRHVQRTLSDRKEYRMAALLAGYEPVRNRTRDSENDRQQGARTRMPPVEFRRLLAAAFGTAGATLPVPRAIAQAGFAVARGDKAGVLMVVHSATGAAYSLKRSLKAILPEPINLSERDLVHLWQQAGPLSEVVRDGLVNSHRLAEARLDRQIRKGMFENAIDGGRDRAFVEHLRRRSPHPRHDTNVPLGDRRKAIRSLEREARLVEARRIDRAFRAARILQSAPLRKAAAVLAASGALLAGAGFPLAIGAGFAAAALIRSQARIQRGNAQALVAARRARSKSPRQGSTLPMPASFTFDIVPKDHRILVGIASQHYAMGHHNGLTAAISRVVGIPLIESLRAFLDTASDAQRDTLRRWAKNTPAHRHAAVSALRRGGEVSAADLLEGQQRRRQRERPVPGREREQ